jgi:plasmid rolling circle replication initiator protein Rep
VPFQTNISDSPDSIEKFSPSNRIDGILLSDNLQDTPWDKHRRFADRVMSHYSGSEFERYAERIALCSQLLEFDLQAADSDGIKLQLRSARFCRVRHCPVCQWRRSLMWKAKAYQILPKVIEKYPTHRWLFMTLTQKNIHITELRETLTEMNKSFKRMVGRKRFPGIGWLRATEVTKGKYKTAHPHFHCLLMVRPSYFSHNYIKQSEWVELWRDCLRLDYNPIIDIRAVKKELDPSVLIPELLKYCTKESDMVADREWFLALTQQLHNMRAISTGGVLKEYLRELELLESVDTDLDKITQECNQILFGWQQSNSKYEIVRHSAH